ncbi:MAG: helix-turn-helix domain-containing protein [Pyrinomonadaceae bacterium]
MSALVSEINLQKYGKLLAKVRPAVIRTEAENTRMLNLVEQLLAKGDKLTPEEGELVKLLGKLIADFEEKFYHLEDAEPYEVLKELMDARGLKQTDLAQLFGSKGRASEVINGKRAISKAQAKALAEVFHVSAELFI